MKKMHLAHRCRALRAVALAIVGLVVSSSPAVHAQGEGMLFTGAGVGPTIDVAIQSAIWDAETSASAYQLFNCQLVGEPSIFPGPNPAWSRNFTAEATVMCTS